MGIAGEDFSGRLTLNLGAIKMENGFLSALVDIRYPVNGDAAVIKDKIQKAFAGFSIEELTPCRRTTCLRIRNLYRI